MMKRCLAGLAALVLLGLAGCAEMPQNESASPTEESIADTETQPETLPHSGYVLDGTLPVLRITTVSQEENVMDFVTKPVNDYVARSIASWTPGYKMPPAPYYESCTVTLTDTDSSVPLNGVSAQVKVRGNWTTSYDKKPLRLKFTETQNLLGLNEGAKMKNWVLLAEYKDASMLRDKTALAIAREILAPHGLYAADAAFVEVEINGQYWGVYLLTEQQQINIDRVDITEAAAGYTGTDIGYFMEFDGYYTNEEPLQQFEMTYADNAPLIPFDGGNSGKPIKPLAEGRRDPKQNVGISIKSDIYSQEQHDFIAAYTNNVYTILYEAAYNDSAWQFNADYTEIAPAEGLTPQQAVEQVLDVQSLADMYIISELTCDADIYWSSFFMSADFGAAGSRKLTFEAPWDFDSAMGNKDRCANGEGFYAANTLYDVNDVYKTINPWLAVLMHEDWFQNCIRDTWTEAYDAGVFDRAFAMIDADTAEYQAAFARSEQRWDNIRRNTAASEWSRGAARCRTHEETAAYLKDWLQKRVAFLNEAWHR